MENHELINATLNNVTVSFRLSTISCNVSCCKYSNNNIICFGDFNYTDKHNLTYLASWDLGVRWTYAILVMLVALLGNLSVIIILLKNRLLLRTSVNHFILNMSVADLILAVTGPIPFTIRDTSNFWPLGKVWCHLEGYIQMLVLFVSLASLATISVDRMVGVVRPFHQHLKKRHSLTTIIVIWILSALIAVPWAVYRVYTVHIWKDLTETICGEKDKINIWWIVGVIVLTWLPLSIMVVCYSTILVYFRHKNFRISSQNEHPVITHLKKRVVKMMFVLVVSFACCWLPMQILKISNKSFLDPNGQYKDEATEKSYKILLSVAQYMVYINPALNPIVYALMHQTFRRAFRVTFPCFFNRKSSLVLTPGDGMRRYMWSYRSTTTSCGGGNDNNNITRRRRETGGRGTPAAVLSTSSLAATIALDSTVNSSDTELMPVRYKRTSHHKNKLTRTGCSSVGYERPLYGSYKKMSRSLSSESSLDVNPEEANNECVCTSKHANQLPLSYVNEGYVSDLQNLRMSSFRTGALGYLITQVIEEETSSDVERERVL